MTHRSILLPLICLLSLSSYGQVTPDSIGKKIDSIFGSQKGFFALAFKDLTTGKELLVHENESFHAASTMKVPVLIELYHQASLGHLKLSDSLVLKNEFTSIADSSLFHLDSVDDSEQELYKHIGEKRTIHELAYQMITVSSNFATNLLIDKVSPRNITATLRELGAADIHVLRGVEDNAAYQRGMNNTVTAGGLQVLFEKMANGALISPAASTAMIRILLDQHYNEIIPARLPAGTQVAHKTGWIKGINHDAGIVFLPDNRKYVLVLLSKDTEDEKASIAAMAAVSEMLYQYVMSSH
ncbi:MAG TPA: serine hydrolase [Puia sp.]